MQPAALKTQRGRGAVQGHIVIQLERECAAVYFFRSFKKALWRVGRWLRQHLPYNHEDLSPDPPNTHKACNLGAGRQIHKVHWSTLAIQQLNW